MSRERASTLGRSWSKQVSRVLALVLCAAGSGALGGCYRVRVQSGLPPGDTAPNQDFRWYNTFGFGLVQPEGPIDLGELCPTGWAELEEQTDLLTGSVAVATLGLYTPHRVTVVCARPGEDVPAMFGYDPIEDHEATYPATRAGDPPPPPRPQRPAPAQP
jgi:hypothetical protein